MANSIETGVDKLVDLIAEKKKISLGDAAKELGVSQPVVQEWADFLEEQGMICVEDRLRETFLVERKLTKTEVEKKAKEYASKKDAFVRKVEIALTSMQRESQDLTKIKDEFGKLKDAIGRDIDRVRGELQELKHYEDLKKNIDKDIMQQRVDYHAMIEGIHKKMTEEKARVEKYFAELTVDKTAIEEAKVELAYLEKKQDNLKKRVAALSELIKTVQGDIETQHQKITGNLQNFSHKVAEADKMHKSLKTRLLVEMEPLVRKAKDNEERILAVQNSILKKITEKNREIDKYAHESSTAADKFKAFFDKKLKTHDMILDLEAQRKELEKEFVELINKAKAFQLSLHSTDVKNYVKELEVSFRELEKKRTGLKTKLGALTDYISGK